MVRTTKTSAFTHFIIVFLPSVQNAIVSGHAIIDIVSRRAQIPLVRRLSVAKLIPGCSTMSKKRSLAVASFNSCRHEVAGELHGCTYFSSSSMLLYPSSVAMSAGVAPLSSLTCVLAPFSSRIRTTAMLLVAHAR